MNWHHIYPDWSKLMHETAAELAAADGFDPRAPHLNPDGSITFCGPDIGYFTNTDFYLPAAMNLIGPPAEHGFAPKGLMQ